jgi:hypothetical protein
VIRLFLTGLTMFGAYLFWTSVIYFYSKMGIDIPGIEVSYGMVKAFLTVIVGYMAWKMMED